MPTARPPSCHAPACAAGTQALGLSGTDSGVWVLEAAVAPTPHPQAVLTVPTALPRELCGIHGQQFQM